MTVDDLGPGWTVMPLDDPETQFTATELSSEDFGASCPDGQETLKTEMHDSAGAAFMSADFRGVAEALVAAPDAAEHMADLKTAFESCVSSSEAATTLADFPVWSMTELPVPDGVGDEAFAYRWRMEMSANGTALPAVGESYVFVRNGNTIEVYMFILNSDSGLSDESVSIVRSGDAKVTTAAG